MPRITVETASNTVSANVVRTEDRTSWEAKDQDGVVLNSSVSLDWTLANFIESVPDDGSFKLITIGDRSQFSFELRMIETRPDSFVAVVSCDQFVQHRMMRSSSRAQAIARVLAPITWNVV
jgi:hypothetical protein